MPIIIFEVTEDNHLLFFNPESFRFFRQKISPHVAYLYQIKLNQDIVIHSYYEINATN